MSDDLRELKDFQLTSTQMNKLIAICERFRRYDEKASREKMGAKLKQIDEKVKKHDKQIKCISSEIKRLLIRIKNNKMRLICVLLVLICLFAALGCSPKSRAANYFPCDPGYAWKYIKSDGTISLVSVKEGKGVLRDSGRLFNISILNASGEAGKNSELCYIVTDSAGYYCGKATAPLKPGLTILKFPLKAGMAWTISKFKDYRSLARVEKKEKIRVPAGIFECYKVSYVTKKGTTETQITNVWFGRKAGIVKVALGDLSVVQLLEKNF
jgi:hypothetical protein